MLTVNIAKLRSRCSPAHHHLANDHDALCVCACMPLCVCMCMCPCMFSSAEDLLLLHLPHYLHSLGDYCRAGRDLRRCVLLSDFQSAPCACAQPFFLCLLFFLYSSFSLPARHLCRVHIAALPPPSHPAAHAAVGVLSSTRFRSSCCCSCVFPACLDGSPGVWRVGGGVGGGGSLLCSFASIM